jgi:hypothetical protein
MPSAPLPFSVGLPQRGRWPGLSRTPTAGQKESVDAHEHTGVLHALCPPGGPAQMQTGHTPRSSRPGNRQLTRGIGTHKTECLHRVRGPVRVHRQSNLTETGRTGHHPVDAVPRLQGGVPDASDVQRCRTPPRPVVEDDGLDGVAQCEGAAGRAGRGDQDHGLQCRGAIHVGEQGSQRRRGRITHE